MLDKARYRNFVVEDGKDRPTPSLYKSKYQIVYSITVFTCTRQILECKRYTNYLQII